MFSILVFYFMFGLGASIVAWMVALGAALRLAEFNSWAKTRRPSTGARGANVPSAGIPAPLCGPIGRRCFPIVHKQTVGAMDRDMLYWRAWKAPNIA